VTVTKAKRTFTPVTFSHLRREAKWLHLYCTVCGHEREFDVSKPPFQHLPDDTVVPTLGLVMVCSKCKTKGKIWSVPEFHGASAETLKRWRSQE
jgi:hypothetical protein